MLYATINTINTLRCTLKESVIDVPSFTYYLMRIFGNNGDYAVILSPTIDVARYSEFSLDLTQDDFVNGAVLITESEEYKYQIYGQTSDSNLDYTDISVVGLLESGTIIIGSGTPFYVDLSSALLNDVQL